MDRLQRGWEVKVEGLADILQEGLPGYLKMEVEAMPDFWQEYAENVAAALNRQADTG